MADQHVQTPEEGRTFMRAVFDEVVPLLEEISDPKTQMLVAWKLVDDTVEIVREKREGDPAISIKCRKGCAWCCRVNVEVGWLEAAVLAALVIHDFPEFEPALRREAEARRGKRPTEVFGRWCPFLVDQQCAVYSHRPMICRGYASIDVEACKGTAETPVPLVAEPLHVAKAVAAGLLASTEGPALADEAGELCAMVVSEIDRQRAETTAERVDGQ